MTREEAVKRFETLLLHVDTDCVMGMETTEAINMAIKALKQPKPCDDTISRQAAIDDLHGKDPSQIWDTADVEVWVNALPSAQPEIIRCRDCKHWDKTWTNDWSPDYHYCPMIDGVCKGDFYCADAERRTDE